MLLIETYLDISPGKGFGLFSKSGLRAGTKYWIRNEAFDRLFPPEKMNSFGKITSDYIQFHGFLEPSGNWYLCGDNARFTNHSIQPNTGNNFNENGIIQYSIVSNEINAGEEILCDYSEICMAFRKKIGFIDF